MLISFLEELIKFKTVSHDQHENSRALKWIKKQLKDLPIYITDFESNGYPSLIVTTQKTKTPEIWLQAHLDVVPGSEHIFKPRHEGNKLYGRGTFDMKFAIACYLTLLQDLKEKLSAMNIGVMLTSDEEIGGENGVKELLDQSYASKICFLPDGGQNWEFQTWAKGAYHFTVEAKGKTAHGSRPWRGKNAIDMLIAFIIDLQKEFVKEPCGIPDHKHNTINIGKIQGGKAANQIADTAQADIDIRFLPGTGLTTIKQRIKKLAKEHHVIIKNLVTGNSYRIDMNNRYLQLFSEITKNKYNIQTSATFSHGSSDARYFIDKEIPAILIRPAGGNLHSEEEWIDIDDLGRFYEILREFILKM